MFQDGSWMACGKFQIKWTSIGGGGEDGFWNSLYQSEERRKRQRWGHLFYKDTP